RLIEQQPIATAHVQQPTARHVPGEQVQEPPRRSPAPTLLYQVGLIVHLAIEILQLRTLWKRGLVHGPTGATAVEVAMLAYAMATRLKGRRCMSCAATPPHELERASSDPTGGGGRHDTTVATVTGTRLLDPPCRPPRRCDEHSPLRSMSPSLPVLTGIPRHRRRVRDRSPAASQARR